MNELKRMIKARRECRNKLKRANGVISIRTLSYLGELSVIEKHIQRERGLKGKFK